MRNPTKEAVDPTTPPERLEELAEQNSKLARRVAKNPTTPSTLLRKLALKGDHPVRHAVAQHPSTPVDVLEKLAEAWWDEDICHAIARNLSTPISLLKILARNESEYVRSALIENLNTPEDLWVEVLETIEDRGN
jgi:hypothetical protein